MEGSARGIDGGRQDESGIGIDDMRAGEYPPDEAG